MAIVAKFSGSDLTGLTVVDPGANADVSVVSGAIRAWKLVGTYGSGWGDLGFKATSAVATSAGYVFYCQGKAVTTMADCMWLINKADTILFGTSSGLYYSGAVALFGWRQSTTQGSFAMASGDWKDMKIEITSDTNIKVYARVSTDVGNIDPDSAAWTEVASMTTGLSGYVGNIRFCTTAFTGTANDTEGQFTTQIFVTTNGSFAPTAPSDLSATTVSATQINLSWTDNGTSVSEDTISIERSLSSGSGFSEIDTVAQGTTSYSDTGLDPETTYYYKIRGQITPNSHTFSSAYTSEASAETEADSDPGADALMLDILD